MASSALKPARGDPRFVRLPWARILVWAPVVLVLAVSLLELLLADRKFGLFSGGFGMSRAVDTVPEVVLFLGAYAAAQALLGLAGWWLASWLTRERAAWRRVFLFALTNGMLFSGVLAAQYQLASYFSDAVGFALMKQLGGGSFLDAILFGSNEIGLAVVVVAVVAVASWLAWRALACWLPDDLPAPGSVPPWAWLAVAPVVGILAIAIPRSGNDAAYALNRTLAWSALTGALDLASDVDGDGYGLFSIQHDGAPFDSSRHPLAFDVPGNGLDEDGYGGDLQPIPLSRPLGPQIFDGQRPHVVIVVLESLRGDVIGKRIGGRAVAPNLEALAAAGSAVPAYSHVGFTTESLKSLFSGQLAPRNDDPSLFRDLKASGYRIGVFSGQPEDFGGISETVAMRGSADVHIDAETLRTKRAFDFAAQGSLLVDERHLLAAFDRTLGASDDWSVGPHFAYFNFQSAHFPYDHPGVERRITRDPLARGEITAANAERVRATYWNAVANADRWLGAVVARLKAKGVWDDTLLIVTGDHGEELFEGGFLGHGHVINREQFQTVLVTNRKHALPAGPIGLSDYRAILSAAVRRVPPPRIEVPPFLHIGPLDTPTAIGIASRGGLLTSLRLDSGEACFIEQRRCAPYSALSKAERTRVDAVVARWGTERWRERQRQPSLR